jgi:hypothetical protein
MQGLSGSRRPLLVTPSQENSKMCQPMAKIKMDMRSATGTPSYHPQMLCVLLLCLDYFLRKLCLMGYVFFRTYAATYTVLDHSMNHHHSMGQRRL